MEFKNKKSLGQNFLIDKNILKKIISIVEISNKDKVIEVGPGTGNLTKYIINYLLLVDQKKGMYL